MSKSVFCINCGLKNSTDSKFCIGCGSKLEAVAQTEPLKEEPVIEEKIPVVSTKDETISIYNTTKEEYATDETSAFESVSSDNSPVFSETGDETVTGEPDGRSSSSDALFSPVFSEVSDDAPAFFAADESFDKTVAIGNIEPIGAAAFSSVNEPEKEETAAVQEKEEKKAKIIYTEEDFAFATGLPEWSLEPPQVVVRRRKG